ncbi:MAG: TolC family protein [Bacteroidetes bacterium]|nr:TolC family protein [Bacteroidota bacterium]
MKKISTFLIFILIQNFNSQTLSLKDCITKAMESNTSITLAKQSVETNKEQYEGSRKNMLPKVDLLAGYNYLGKPLEVNLQQTKDGIVEGSALQSANAASTIYEQITGNPLNANVWDMIYQTSRDIISAVYPNYNPALSKQDYLMAGIMVRQPIYLGGKLKAVQKLKEQQFRSSEIHLENAQDLVVYNVTLQYLQVLYYNSMIEKEEQKIVSLQKNEQYAAQLLKSEIIPPYMKKWSDVALMQGKTSLENLKLERENALLTLKQMMGMPLNSNLEIQGKLPEQFAEMDHLIKIQTENNTDIRWLNAKKEEANTALKVAKSLNHPNVFAIGNAQFLRKDLPVITPPWMVGIEMQWTLFNGFENKNKIKAAESLVKESELLIKQKQETVDLAVQLAQNKIKAIQNQSETLDAARKETYTTTDMIRKRMENSLSSVKDVNDALQLQYSSEKLYYTSLVAYQTALATYYYLNGQPENITQIID